MLEGVYTALVTPFSDDLRIDHGVLEALVDRQIAGGVSGLVPMGTTGESPTVTHQENIEVIAVVARRAEGKAQVIAGTGSNSTQEAVDMTRKARDLGVQASLQVAPYYNKPSQEGLYAHFSTIADSVDLPLLVYNIPGRTGRNIETDTLLRLAAHPNIVGVKEASGNLSQMMDILARRPDGFAVLSGDDNMTLALTLLGGQGVVSVASNIVPERMTELTRRALEGNTEEARALHYGLMPLFTALLGLDTNPVPVKYALKRMGLVSGKMRLPMVELAGAAASRMDEVLQALGLV